MRYSKRNYKYKVEKTFQIKLEGCPKLKRTPYLEEKLKKHVDLEFKGENLFLIVKHGYAWDGVTGAPDLKKLLGPSSVHDPLLQLIGLGQLPADEWKIYADKFFIELCKRNKVCWVIRQLAYFLVRTFGDPEGSKPKKILTVPLELK